MKSSVLLFAVVVSAVLLAAPSAQARGDVALRAAIELETVKGNLKGAIAAYEKVARDYASDRPVAAQALLRLAQAHRRLGNAEARAVLERIVREYQDQPDVVRAAQAQMPPGPAVRIGSVGSTARLVMTDAPKSMGSVLIGGISDEGRYLSFMGDQDGRSDLRIRDLESGREQVIVPGTDDSYPDESAISKDGKRVAYVWWSKDDSRFEIRAADAVPNARPRVLLSRPDIDWMEGLDWSPDGRSIVLQLRRSDRTSAIGMISVADATVRVVKSLDWRWTGTIFFSPDGRHLAYDYPSGQTGTSRDVFVLAVDGSREFSVTTHPADDRVFGWTPDGSALLIVSNRSGSDALWLMPAFAPNGSPVLLKRDFSADEPVGATRSGALFYGLSRLNGLDLQIADFDAEAARLTSAPQTVTAELLSSFVDFDLSADGLTLACVSRRGREVALVVQNFVSGEVRRLPLRLREASGVRFSGDGRSVLVRGVDDRKGGVGVDRISLATGDVERILREKVGPQRYQVSPDGSRLFVHRELQGENGSRHAAVERQLSTGSERVLIERERLGPVHLSPDGRFIATGFADPDGSMRSIALVSTASGDTRELMRVDSAGPARRPSLAGSDQSQISVLMWSPDSQSVFIRRNGKQGREIWRVPLDGTARRVGLDIERLEGPIRVSRDGKRVAFAVRAAAKPAELWVLENFLPPAADPRK